MGKEHRKPYYGSKAFDYSCRSHGDCSACNASREYKNKKRAPIDSRKKYRNYDMEDYYEYSEEEV